MRKQRFEFNIVLLGKAKDSPRQNICVDIDKQERNQPNLGPIFSKQQNCHKIFKQNYEEQTALIFNIKC